MDSPLFVTVMVYWVWPFSGKPSLVWPMVMSTFSLGWSSVTVLSVLLSVPLALKGMVSSVVVST